MLSGLRRVAERPVKAPFAAGSPRLYSARGRRASAIRAIAWGAVVAGTCAPLLRKRVPVRPIVMQAIAFAAPVGLGIAVRRSRRRDVAICALQMWAYLAAYKAPHDDQAAQAARVHVDYPIVIDRALGLGELPTLRLQRSLARVRADGTAQWRGADAALVWAHWVWFAVPHASLLYILARHPERFPRAAALTYAVFDVGACFYWLLPTAPPWYVPVPAPGEDMAASSAHELDARSRRMMVEYGEHFWRDGWEPLYSVLGGNPLAAMPSLHFATSLMAAFLLTEVGPFAGALGAGYTATLGFALVYLGEHYVVDILGGAALTIIVKRLGHRVGPALSRAGGVVAALEAMAHEAS